MVQVRTLTRGDTFDLINRTYKIPPLPPHTPLCEILDVARMLTFAMLSQCGAGRGSHGNPSGTKSEKHADQNQRESHPSRINTVTYREKTRERERERANPAERHGHLQRIKEQS